MHKFLYWSCPWGCGGLLVAQPFHRAFDGGRGLGTESLDSGVSRGILIPLVGAGQSPAYSVLGSGS